MSDRAIQRHWVLLQAAFLESSAGQHFLKRHGQEARSALTLLVEALSTDLGETPEGLDGEKVRDLMLRILPARMDGGENYAPWMPDLVEEFLTAAAQECGLASTFEWVHAVGETRDGYAAAMRNPNRPRALGPAQFTPDVRPSAKLGRNDPCPCGSGRKYKKCCGGNG
jgi:hypothetical protein